jgi:hypothetical protein
MVCWNLEAHDGERRGGEVLGVFVVLTEEEP